MAFPQVHYFTIITSVIVISSTTFGITSLSCKTAFNWTNEQSSILKRNLLYGQIYINFIHGGQLNPSAEHSWWLTRTEGLSRRWMSFLASADESSVMTHILETICVLYQLFNLLASCFVSSAVLYQDRLNLLSLYHLETSAVSNESTRVTWLGMRTLRGWWWYKLTLYGDNDDYEYNEGGDGETNPPYKKTMMMMTMMMIM